MAEVCDRFSPLDIDKENIFALTPEEYQITYWPTIQSAVRYLLSHHDGNCSLSYERVYGSVYNCVCRQYGEKLFQDLCYEVKSHFSTVKTKLQATRDEDLINAFDYVLQEFKNALDGIIPLFNCMNRFYLGRMLETDLKTELSNLFVSELVNDVICRLFEALRSAWNVPFAADPATVARVIKELHYLNKEYVQQAPEIFARYIPNVLPPMQVSDLPEFVKETQQWQQHLHSVGFLSGDQSRKRAGDEITVYSLPSSEY